VRLSAGQNVVLPAEEFPSDVYPWMTRCSQDGAELRLVPRPADGSARAFNERLLEAIDGHTAVVNLSSVHWTDGLRFDLAAIGTRARDVGAWFIVDASQTVGAAPFDFAAVQPDLLVCVGYKWLLGTYQLGFAAVGERLREAIPFEQHWGNRDVDTSSGDTSYVPTYRAGARRFDGGEHANSITLPMFREGVRQVEAWGGAAIQAYCTELGKRLQPLAEQDLVQMPAPSDRYAHIVGLRPRDEAAVPRLVQELARRNVRVAQRGSALRVSPYVYNTPQDLDALCETLTDVLA
jgi:selenocysteine lyase/cysteine desulfurase